MLFMTSYLVSERYQNNLWDTPKDTQNDMC